mgnify:CR=1 FL=1
MRLDARSLIPEHLRGAIIALGNFDGFHLGHQAVVGEAVRWAKAEGRPAIVATFDPHPVRYFKPDAAPFRLTTLDQRERLFAEAGADCLYSPGIKTREQIEATVKAVAPQPINFLNSGAVGLPVYDLA